MEYLRKVKDCFRKSQSLFLHMHGYRVNRTPFVAEISDFPYFEALFCLEQFY